MKTCHRLLLFVAVILFPTTAAMADCWKCLEINNQCHNAPKQGFEFCVNDIDLGCILSGDPCTSFASEQSLASEYSVAAVERIDQPQPAAKEEPLVAPSETEAPPSR
jgi:hypothetical protein